MVLAVEKKLNLLDIVSKCLKEHDDDIETTVVILTDLIMNTPEYHKTYVLPLVQHELRNQCRKVFSRRRSYAINGMAQDVQDGYISAIRQEYVLLLDFPLPIRGGIKMRYATRPMLAEATGEYYQQARTMMIRRKWFEYVAQRLTDDHKTVGQVLDEQTLGRLYKEAEEKIT